MVIKLDRTKQIVESAFVESLDQRLVIQTFRLNDGLLQYLPGSIPLHGARVNIIGIPTIFRNILLDKLSILIGFSSRIPAGIRYKDPFRIFRTNRFHKFGPLVRTRSSNKSSGIVAYLLKRL